MANKTEEFDLLLMDSIDEALLSLGEKASQSIYGYLEKSYGLSKNGLPKNLETFQQALEKIFGIGARLIEILVMKNLSAKLGLRLNMENNKELEFVKYIKEARKAFIEKSSNKSN